MSFLQKTYNRDDFVEFLKNDFLSDYEADLRSVEVSDKSLLKDVQKLGGSEKLGISVFEAKCDESDHGKRVAITQDAFRVLRDTATRNALIVFYSEKKDNWRISLLTSTFDLKNGKVVSKMSNPKRYSYLLGPGAKTVTPNKFLIKNGSVGDFEDLQKRFSVEVVNNEFYKEIAKLYDQLVGTQDIKAALKYPNPGEESHQFAVRLIGRIVFCWFLREKHSNAGIPLISKEILSSEAARGSGYYHTILAPVFFEVLNKHIDKRTNKFRDGAFGQVPYLNGGLFSPQYDDHYKFDASIELSVPGLVDVPDEWIQSLFELLETYNFTVDENTSVDIDLSIDPEMLGRIFENLLARINPETGETVRKSTGSFYTPREIVEYMVDESLIQYLLSKTGLDEKKLRALISYDLTDDLESPLEDNEKQTVVNALVEVKILDPACGSGAFPIGILQKIVFALQQVDPQAKFWFKNQIDNTPPELRQILEREFEHKNFDYIRKLGVIRESIFGVDIQPIATEIARLRCFLTLIVDERVNDSEQNRGVEPLPNLDFKFVTANTLINLGMPKEAGAEQAGLFEDQTGIDELKSLRDEYFNSHNSERDSLKLQFSQVQNRMLQNMIANHSHGYANLTQKLSSWDPFNHKSTVWFDPEWMFGIRSGFDIVIGNPPYIQLQKDSGKLADIYADQKYQTFSRTGDIYSLFYERGLSYTVLDSGLLCYITSNKWMRAGYGEKTRKFFCDNDPLILLDFGGFKVFESATVDTNILLIKNRSNTNGLKAAHFEGDYIKGQPVYEYFSSHNYLLSNLSNEAWYIGNPTELKLKNKISSVGKPLKDWDVKIYRGVVTGCNEAFIIDEANRTKLISKDPKNTNIIKKLIRGKDIKRYSAKFSGMYILATGVDIDIQNEYPSIYSYIKSVGEGIERGEIKAKGKGVFDRDDKGKNWWNLRACAYYDDFDKEKIIWSDISTEPSFDITQEGEYINNTAYMITGGNLLALLGILNSGVTRWLFPKIATDLGEGGARYFKQFVELIPVPVITNENISIFHELTQAVQQLKKKYSEKSEAKKVIEDEINHLVYKLYELTPEEIEIINSSIEISK